MMVNVSSVETKELSVLKHYNVNFHGMRDAMLRCLNSSIGYRGEQFEQGCVALMSCL